MNKYTSTKKKFTNKKTRINRKKNKSRKKSVRTGGQIQALRSTIPRIGRQVLRQAPKIAKKSGKLAGEIGQEIATNQLNKWLHKNNVYHKEKRKRQMKNISDKYRFTYPELQIPNQKSKVTDFRKLLPTTPIRY